MENMFFRSYFRQSGTQLSSSKLQVIYDTLLSTFSLRMKTITDFIMFYILPAKRFTMRQMCQLEQNSKPTKQLVQHFLKELTTYWKVLFQIHSKYLLNPWFFLFKVETHRNKTATIELRKKLYSLKKMIYIEMSKIITRAKSVMVSGFKMQSM